MIWKPVIIRSTVDSACQNINQAMRLKELSVELRDRIVSRHRSGEGYQMSAALKVPKNTVASIILPRLYQDSYSSWPPSQTDQSGEKSLGQGGDLELNGHSDRALEFCQSGQPSLQHSTKSGL